MSYVRPYSTDVFSQRKPGEPVADGAHKHSWPYQFVYAVLNSRSKTELLVDSEQLFCGFHCLF